MSQDFEDPISEYRVSMTQQDNTQIDPLNWSDPLYNTGLEMDWQDDFQDISLRTVDFQSSFEQAVPMQKEKSTDYFDDELDEYVKSIDPVIKVPQWKNSNLARSVHPTIVNNGKQPVTSLGVKFQGFYEFKYFNAVQSQCFDPAFLSSKNMVISAPTGAGKTVIMELAILRLVSQNSNTNAKIVYIAPTKALCEERNRDWQKFNKFGLTTSMFTGDTTNSHSSIQKCNIIITTPEKWDSMTRQWKDSKNLMKIVRLLLVDEIHTLKDENRGGTLEVVITRMMTMKRMDREFPDLRIIAVSATVPNLDDFATWLSEKEPAVCKKFGEEYRPVKLERFVYAYPISGTLFAFEENLKYKLTDIICKHSDNKPVMIFCATRKSTVMAAEYLVQESMNTSTSYITPQIKRVLMAESERIIDKKLAKCVQYGIAYHNGGVEFADRSIIESLFIKSYILVICTTSTLAVGVNLPAHLVIIKGTSQWEFQTAKFKDYSDHDINQMIGRAGRPQFDDTGVAVILTTIDRKNHFDGMMSGKELIESSLHKSLIEHLNAEIVLGTIKSIKMAMEWLKSTFLYVRIKKNPGFYQLKNCGKEEAGLTAETRLETIFIQGVDQLFSNQLVDMDSSKATIKSTEYGAIMAKYYMRFHTMTNLIRLRVGACQKDLLETLIKSEEFKDIRFQGDKKILNTLNKNPEIRFPTKKIVDTSQKASLCIQALIAGLTFEKPSLGTEANQILQQATRLNRGVLAVYITKQDYASLISAIKLTRSIQCRMWETSPLKVRQIEGIGPAMATLLADANITSFESLLKCESGRIDMIVGRNPPFGRKILDACRTLPKIDIQINTNSKEHFVTLTLKNIDAKTMIRNNPIVFYFVAGTILGGLVEFRKINVISLKDPIIFSLRVCEESIVCSILCHDIVGLDVEKHIKGTSVMVEGAKRTQSSGNVSAYFGQALEDTSIMDDKYWAGLDDFDLDQMIEREPEITGHVEVDIQKYVPCNHSCRDKKTCHHMCCKTGAMDTKKRKSVASKKAAANLQSTRLSEDIPVVKKDINSRSKRQFVSLAEHDNDSKKTRIQSDMSSDISIDDIKEEVKQWKSNLTLFNDRKINTISSKSQGKQKERRSTNDEKIMLDKLHSSIPMNDGRNEFVDNILPSDNMGNLSEIMHGIFDDECELEFEEISQDKSSSIQIQSPSTNFITSQSNVESEYDQLESGQSIINSQQQRPKIKQIEEIKDIAESEISLKKSISFGKTNSLRSDNAQSIDSNNSFMKTIVPKPSIPERSDAELDKIQNKLAATMKNILSEFIF